MANLVKQPVKINPGGDAPALQKTVDKGYSNPNANLLNEVDMKPSVNEKPDKKTRLDAMARRTGKVY